MIHTSMCMGVHACMCEDDSIYDFEQYFGWIETLEEYAFALCIVEHWIFGENVLKIEI